MDKQKKCTFCAELINNEAIKCKHCGEFLENNKHFPTPNLTSTQEKELKNATFAPVVFGWIYLIGMRAHKHSWMIILFLIPVVNICTAIYLAFKGKEIAWNDGKWENFDLFYKRQRIFEILTAVTVIIILVILFFVYATLN